MDAPEAAAAAALERIGGSGRCALLLNYKIEPLTHEHINGAFALATEVFASASTLHTALGVDLTVYRSAIRPSFERMIAEGLSWVAIDESGTMQGCLIATDLHATLCDPSPSGPYSEISALTQALVQKYRSVRTFGPREVLLVDMAAVRHKARGSGIYRALRQQVQEAGRSTSWRHVVGELSSPATQHVVLSQMGHRNVAEIAFKSFEWNGARPFAAIPSPVSIILAEGAL